jgi:hypothetical protein
MYSFDIAIENIEKRVKQGKALHFMAACMLLAVAAVGFSKLPESAMYIYAGLPIGILVMAIMIFKIKWLTEIKHIRWLRVLEATAISACAVLLFTNKQYVPGVLFFITAILLLFTLAIEMQLHMGVRVMVDEKGVTRIVGNRTRIIAWPDIENVVVNSNILTVDMKDNYLMQSKFTNPFDKSDVAKFNDYCKVYLMINEKGVI